jgi:hypothetical protein
MKYVLHIALFFFVTLSSAQTTIELTPQGFASIEMKTPDKPLDQLITASKSWASVYNKKGADVSEVTENSLTVDAKIVNAYYTYNVGVKYNYDIEYTLKIEFQSNKTYTMRISVKDIYTENIVVKTKTADFFTAEGKVKDDFKDAKPSLENSINKVLKSYVNFIAQ